MNTGTVSVHVIPSSASLDAITIFFQDFEPGQGRMVVECYGNAWAAYWGAMGGKTVREFVRSADVYYLTNKLSRPNQNKTTDKYLQRLVEAIKADLK
jgi:hypothetical protein